MPDMGCTDLWLLPWPPVISIQNPSDFGHRLFILRPLPHIELVSRYNAVIIKSLGAAIGRAGCAVTLRRLWSTPPQLGSSPQRCAVGGSWPGFRWPITPCGHVQNGTGSRALETSSSTTPKPCLLVCPGLVLGLSRARRTTFLLAIVSCQLHACSSGLATHLPQVVSYSRVSSSGMRDRS